jgi:hypothetical protein
MFCSAGTSGTGNSEHGHVEVVNLAEVFDPIGVPSTERAFPLTLAAYVTPPTSGEDGVRVAVSVESSYDTDAGTNVPSAAKSWKVDVVIEAGAIERENDALIVADRSMNVAPSAGVIDVTCGPSTVVKPQDVPANGVPSKALIVLARCAV